MQTQAKVLLVSLDPIPVLSDLEQDHGSSTCVIIRQYLFVNLGWCLVSHLELKSPYAYLTSFPGTSGKGLTVVGKFAKNLVKGEMTVVPTLPRQYTVMGDVTVDNVIVARNQTIIMDVGTDNIQGYELSVSKDERYNELNLMVQANQTNEEDSRPLGIPNTSERTD